MNFSNTSLNANNNNNHQQCARSIFIGSIDPKLTKQSIMNYFKNLGLDLYFLKKKNNRSKNYIVAKTTDTRTFKFLSEHKKEHKIGGNGFITAEYLTGDQKVLKDAEEARKKLYVGNLPLGTSDEELKEFFSGFGKIKTAYVSKKRTPSTASGKFGFVVFQFKHTAKTVLELNSLYFKGVEITLKPFKSKWAKIPKKENKMEENQPTFNNLDSHPIGNQNMVRSLNKVSNVLSNFQRSTSSYDDPKLLDFVSFKHRVEQGNLRLNKPRVSPFTMKKRCYGYWY